MLASDEPFVFEKNGSGAAVECPCVYWSLKIIIGFMRNLVSKRLVELQMERYVAFVNPRQSCLSFVFCRETR
jgi:hypothetical protein